MVKSLPSQCCWGVGARARRVVAAAAVGTHSDSAARSTATRRSSVPRSRGGARRGRARGLGLALTRGPARRARPHGGLALRRVDRVQRGRAPHSGRVRYRPRSDIARGRRGRVF